MDETQYYKSVYNKFWVNQTKKYGYAPYEKKLVEIISQSSPERVFEVGIGTGWPIGTALKEKGIRVDGCDIAESAVALAQRELDNEDGIWTGDIREYKGDFVYDVTYCVRASWCIPGFYQTLKKMIDMTKPGGYVVFDVMDKNSFYCIKSRCVQVKEKYYKFLGIHVDQRYGTHYMLLSELKHFLRKNGLRYAFWREWEITGRQDRKNAPKVVFCCRKER